MSWIQTNQLGKQIANKTLLRDVTLSIEPADFVGVLGPNGSGKTTFLKILAGVDPSYLGEVTLNLIPLRNYSAKGLAQFVAYVPQQVFFPFALTVWDVVSLGRFPWKKRFSKWNVEDEQKIFSLLKKFNLMAFRDRNVQTLSGGELQRVLLARALAQDPRILILDEPASHLDPLHQQELVTLLKELQTEEKITLITVFHDVNLASRVCNKIIWLKQGQMVGFGEASNLLTPQKIHDIFGLVVEELVTSCGQKVFVPKVGRGA